MSVTPGNVVPHTTTGMVDTSEMWDSAIAQYEETTGVRLATLKGVKTVEDILNEVRLNQRVFLGRRHSGSRSDRVRAVLSQSLKPIGQLLEIATQASKGVSLSGPRKFTQSHPLQSN